MHTLKVVGGVSPLRPCGFQSLMHACFLACTPHFEHCSKRPASSYGTMLLMEVTSSKSWWQEVQVSEGPASQPASHLLHLLPACCTIHIFTQAPNMPTFSRRPTGFFLSIGCLYLRTCFHPSLGGLLAVPLCMLHISICMHTLQNAHALCCTVVAGK
jgi:hypothetical protein